jgi:hypothetical protein
MLSPFSSQLLQQTLRTESRESEESCAVCAMRSLLVYSACTLGERESESESTGIQDVLEYTLPYTSTRAGIANRERNYVK